MLICPNIEYEMEIACPHALLLRSMYSQRRSILYLCIMNL